MPISITEADYIEVEAAGAFTSMSKAWAFACSKRSEPEAVQLLNAAGAGYQFSRVVGNVLPLVPWLHQRGGPAQMQIAKPRRGRASRQKAQSEDAWSKMLPEIDIDIANNDDATVIATLKTVQQITLSGRKYYDDVEQLLASSRAFASALKENNLSKAQLQHWKQPLQAASAFAMWFVGKRGWRALTPAELVCILIRLQDDDLEDCVTPDRQRARLKVRGQTMRRVEKLLVPTLDRIVSSS